MRRATRAPAGTTALVVAAIGALFGGEMAAQQTALSFEPAGVTQGDGWHRLEVKVPRQRVSVSAREGYWAGVR